MNYLRLGKSKICARIDFIAIWSYMKNNLKISFSFYEDRSKSKVV